MNKLLIVTLTTTLLLHRAEAAQKPDIKKQENQKVISKDASGIKSDISASSKKSESTPFKGLKVKIVNGYQVAGSSKKGSVIRQEFISKKEKAEKQLHTEQQKLIEANKEFTAKAAALSDTAKEAEEKKIAKMDRDLKLKAQELKEELETEMYKKTEELGIEFESTVKTYGKEHNLDLVIDESSGRVVYVAENLKCSDEIIKLMDKKFDKKDILANDQTTIS